MYHRLHPRPCALRPVCELYTIPAGDNNLYVRRRYQTIHYYLFLCLFGGFKVLRDVIHDHYIQRPKEREKQDGKEGISTPKSDCPLGDLPCTGNSSNLEPAHCKVAIPQ